MKGKILNLFISSLLVLLAFGSIQAQRGGIYPNQFAKANQAKSIFEYNGTEWLWKVPEFVDSVYLNDSILCWRIKTDIFCDTIRLEFDDQVGTDTSGYNLSFRISNDTIFIRDANSELSVVLPGQSQDSLIYNQVTDSLYLYIGGGYYLVPRIFTEYQYSVPELIPNPRKYDFWISWASLPYGTYYYDGYLWQLFDDDNSPTNEFQTLSYTASTRKLKISTAYGNEVTLPLFATTGTNAGLVNGSNNQTSKFLRGDNTWQDVITSESQSLSIDSLGRVFTISLSGGGNVKFLDTNTDAQKIDTFEVYDTNKLRISLEGDNEPFKLVILPEQDSSKWKWSGDTLINKNTNDPVRVEGTFQVTDLETGNARTLIAEIGDGTFQSVTIGKGLNLNSTTNTLSSTERDSTVLSEGWGIDITESPTNTYTVKVDSSQVATQYDLTQITFPDSTQLTAGFGINVSEVSNNWTVKADTTKLATLYDITGMTTGSGTATRAAFWSGSNTLSSDADFYWDNSNKRLGIGLTNPNQQFELTKNMRFVNTTYNSGNPYGIIYKGSTPFIHDFNYGNNGTVTTAGGNTFIGIDAGNFTTGSTATSASHSSYNVGIGDRTLRSNTTGYQNIALGYGVLINNTTGFQNSAFAIGSLASNVDGYRNTAFGYGTLNANLNGYENTAIGQISLWVNTSGYLNTAIGRSSLVGNTTGYSNTSIGSYSLAGNISGHSNIGIGSNAGRYLSNGSTARETGNYSLYLGTNTKASDNGLTNENVIGYNAVGSGSNTITLGGSANTKTYIPYGGLRLSGLSTSTETAAVMIDGNKDLSYRTLNAVAFNGETAQTIDTFEIYDTNKLRISLSGDGQAFKTVTLPASGSTIDSTTVVNAYGTTITESPANQWNITVDTSKIATLYDIANSANWNAAYNDKINSLAFSGTTTKTLTLTQQDGGTVSNTFTDDNTTYTASTGLTLSGTAFALTGQALALHNLSSNGLIARTSSGNVSARTITANTGISVSNGDGVSGNPTITNTGVTSFNGSTGAISYSGITGSGAANRMAYFTGASTVKGSTLIMKDSTATTSILRIMHTNANGINGLQLFTGNSTPTPGTNLYWQIANNGGNLVFNGANTSSLFKIQNSAGSDKFIFDPNNNKIGVYTPSGIDYGNTTEGTKFLGYDNVNNRIAYLVPTVTVPRHILKKYRANSPGSGTYTVNHTGMKAIRFVEDDIIVNTPTGSWSDTNDSLFTFPIAGYYELNFTSGIGCDCETGSNYVGYEVSIWNTALSTHTTLPGSSVMYHTFTAGVFEVINYSTIVYIDNVSTKKLKVRIQKASGTPNANLLRAEITMKYIP